MSNEVKIGLLAVVTLALSLWGYKFIMGRNALASSNLFYVEYKNVEGLQKATPVRISGYDVGVVANLYLKLDDPERKVVVVLDLRKGIQIPKDTKATIVATGFMGGKAIVLEFDRPCTGDDCAKSGDYLRGETKGMLASMLSTDNAQAYVDIVKSGLQEVIDTLNRELLSDGSSSPIALTFKDLQKTMANLESGTAQLDGLLQRSSGNIERTLQDMSILTSTLRASNDKIKGILANADKISADLAAAELKQTVLDVKHTITSLNSTIGTAETMLQGVSTTLNRINQGEGTLGKLLQNDELYTELKMMSSNIDSLVTDFQGRPYRYMPLKSRRKVQKYDRQDAKEKPQTAASN